MHLHTIAILVFSLSIVGCGNSQPMPNYAETRLQVIAIETAFAKTMSDRDHDAFSTFIADDAVFFAGDDPLRGKEQVVSWWARYYMEVEVLDSGSLAYSTGPVRDPNGTVIGRFNSIWRRDDTGTWRVIFDKGSDVCSCSDQ
jgi:ketosteroid isomerase-like protein